jgi:hypothetical protein
MNAQDASSAGFPFIVGEEAKLPSRVSAMAPRSRRKSRSSGCLCDQPLALVSLHNCTSCGAMTRTLTALCSASVGRSTGRHRTLLISIGLYLRLQSISIAAIPAKGLSSWNTGDPRSRKKRSITSRTPGLSSSNMPSPNVCVMGDSMPSKTAYAPPHSIQLAPLSGTKRRRVSAN